MRLLIRLILFPLKWALKILAPVLLLLAAALVVYLFFWLPDVSILAKEDPETTAFIELTRNRYQNQENPKRIQQTWVGLDEISPALVEAVLIAEDDRFYLHRGFDFTEMMNAMEANLEANRFVRGGSTLSQQLVKNLYLSPEKSYTRKLNEALLTWKLEHTLTKDRILEIYLNVAEWGDGIFGVERAALFYFKKPAKELTEREAVSLAARLPNPHEVGDRPVQRRLAREKVILERLRKTKPGYRGTRRSLLAETKEEKHEGRGVLIDEKSLDRMGELAQQQVDKWWRTLAGSSEPDWKLPTQVPAVPRRPLPAEIPREIPPVGEERTAEIAEPVERVVRAAETRERTEQVSAGPQRSAKPPRKEDASTKPATQQPEAKSEPPRDFQASLARLEELLSKKD